MTINYERDMHIDENALDIEWLEQANKMMKYAQHSAETRATLEKAKESLDLVRAQIDKEIREHPEAFNITKITENAVENTIVQEPQYRDAYQEYLQAKYESDMAYGAVRAMEARKEALENLVRLNGQQYFAGPVSPRNISKERSEWEQRINAKIAQRLRTRNQE